MNIRKWNKIYRDDDNVIYYKLNVKLFVIYSFIIDEVNGRNYEVVNSYYTLRRFKNKCK